MKTLVKIFLFLSIFSFTMFSSEMFFPYITGKILAFRFFIEFAFIFWLISVYRERVLRFQFSEPIVKTLLFFTGVLFVSALFGVNFLFSFWSNFERSEGLFSFLHYLAFFIMILDVFSQDDFYRFIKLFLLLSPFLAYYQFSNYVDLDKRLFGRISGLLGNPSYVATLLVFAFGFGIYLILKNREIIRSTKDTFLVFENIFWGIILLIDVPAFLFTQTRGAYLAVFVAVILYFVFLSRFGGEKEKKVSRYTLLLLSIIIISVVAMAVRSNAIPANLTDLSTLVTRFSTWKSAVYGFLERPILGFGFENFNVVFDRYYDPSHSGLETWFDHAHNILFEYLATTGIVGLAAYLLIFYVFFRFYFPIIFKKRPVAESGIFLVLPIAYFIQNLALFDTLTSYTSFFTFLALARIVTHKESNARVVQPLQIRHLFFGVLVGFFIVISVIGIYTNLIVLQKNALLFKAFLPAQQSLSLGSQLDLYKRLFGMPGFLGRREISTALANSVFTWSSPKKLEKFSEEDLSVLSEGISISENYLAQDVNHIRNYYLIGYAYSSVGGQFKDRKALLRGEELLKKADTLSPGRIEFLEVLIKNLGAQKKYDEALKYSIEIIRLRPDMEAGHRFAGVFYYKIGEKKKGEKELQEALRINPSSTALQFLREERKHD